MSWYSIHGDGDSLLLARDNTEIVRFPSYAVNGLSMTSGPCGDSVQFDVVSRGRVEWRFTLPEDFRAALLPSLKHHTTEELLAEIQRHLRDTLLDEADRAEAGG
jgi:hypothetical protein